MKIWFITGVSSGLGRALAEEVIARGDKVVGTLRNEAQRAEFDSLAQGCSFGVVLDVASDADVPRVVSMVEDTIGPIDILVNNAGYGYEGPIEETPMDEVRRQYEVNVFGALRTIQATLPGMRARRRGHIVNVTSMGGLVTSFPGVGIYNSSKCALEGINEALSTEVACFGIKVSAVEPGGFRTDWAGRSMRRGERSIADYDKVFEPERARRIARSGRQIGDPRKAARAIIEMTLADDPPVHLLLGSDALRFVREGLNDLNREIVAWERLSLSTDADHVEDQAVS